MKTTKLPAALAALLAPSLLFADRISIDIGALASATNQFSSECNVATTNGWTIMGIDSYSGTTVNIRINRNVSDEHIDSPVFAHAITRIELKLKSSAQADRRLAFIPVYDGTATTDKSLWSLCDYSPNKDTYVARTNFFPISANVHAFRMALDDGKGSTGWGVSEMTIVTTDTDPISPPTNLQADNIRGTRCDLSWTNPANAVSNRVDVSEATRITGSGFVERKYDFNEFSNGGTTSQQTESIVSAYPDLSGYMLCLPTNTTGQIQLSNSDDKGVLVIREFESYEGLRLELIARHYNHTKEAETMSIGYVLDGATNDFASVVLASEFSLSSIPLSEVPAGAQLILNNSGNKQFHRVIIDEISFVRNFAVSTNLVKTAVVTDSTTYSVRGLCPRTEYVAKISAFDAEGNESDFSDPLAVRTLSTIPTKITLR